MQNHYYIILQLKKAEFNFAVEEGRGEFTASENQSIGGTVGKVHGHTCKTPILLVNNTV